MDALNKLFGIGGLARLAHTLSDPVSFYTLLAAVALSFVALFFIPMPRALKFLFLLVFLATDATVLWLVFKADPEWTDFDHEAPIDSPSVELADATEFRRSDPVCFPFAAFDVGHALDQVQATCTGDTGAKVARLVRSYDADGRLCIAVQLNPPQGQSCSASGHLHWSRRHRRDGPLQGLHATLGIGAGTNAMTPPFTR